MTQQHHLTMGTPGNVHLYAGLRVLQLNLIIGGLASVERALDLRVMTIFGSH